MPIHRAERSRHRESFPAPPSPALYRNIAYTFVGVTVAIVVAALWFSSVRATVIVKAERAPTSVTASVDVARSPSTGQIPGRVVQGVFEKIQEFEVSTTAGKAVDAISRGKVRITNTYSKPQPLVATTRLLTSDGRLYRIDDTVNVPAGGTVDVAAHSDKAGAQFAFDAKTRFTIPGLDTGLQKLIYAESITPFKGESKTVKTLAQSDIDAGQKTLTDAVLEQAKKTLFAEVADSRFTESAYLVKVIETKTDVKPGEEAERFLMSLKLNVTGVFYPKADMEALVKQRLQERIPEGRDVVASDPTKTTFSVENADASSESATVSVSAEVETRLGEGSPSLTKDIILGLPIADAEQKLETLDGIESVTITVHPSWVRRLPTQKGNITVKVE